MKPIKSQQTLIATTKTKKMEQFGSVAAPKNLRKIIFAFATFLVPTVALCQPLYKDTIVTDTYIEPHRWEVGLILGDMRSTDTVYFNGAFVSTQGSQSKNIFETGIQAKLFLHPITELQTFVYANALTIVDSSYTLFNQVIFPFTRDASVVKIHSGFVARLGVGLQTDPFDNFTASVGGGVALVNQRLDNNIVELTRTTPATITNNSLVPSIMGSLNYEFCKRCVDGHPFILSAQISVDQYPNLRLNTKTLFETTSADLRAKWLAHTDLVFSTKF